MGVTIASLTPARARAEQNALAELLQDAVDSGASLGFLPPLPTDEAAAYWESVAAAVGEGSHVVLVAETAGGALVGAVQLELALRANARHRAEVTKLMVHRRARRQGIGRVLMEALETHARQLGRTTLVLDTRQGDPSEMLYRSLGYVLVGAIPRYARSATGTLDATAIYYKLLEPAGDP